MRRSPSAPLLALSAVLAAAGVASAQVEALAIQGDDVAGRVEVDPETRAVRLAFVTFGKDAAPARTIEGRLLARTSDRLRFDYERDQAGFVPFLRDLVGPRPRERVAVELRRGTDGALAGEVEGKAQRWVTSPPVPDDLVVLVVPGLSTNLWNQYGVPYLDENLATLRARGLEARRLAINTEASVADNAAQIAREVRREVARGKRVLLLAHSKGGADTVTALSDPALREVLPRIVAFGAIQPVYAGSPVADLVGRSRVFQGVADKAFEALLPRVNRETDMGDRDAVRDLRSSARQAALARHPFPADLVPTVVIRGHFTGRSAFRPRHVLRKPLFVLQQLLERRHGIASDGLVSLEWQRIPGARAEVTLENIDHFEPGFRGESPHTPCKITHQLLDLALAAAADR